MNGIQCWAASLDAALFQWYGESEREKNPHRYDEN